MTLKYVADIQEIDGFKVINMDTIKESKPELFNESGGMKWKIFERDIRPNHFVYMRPEIGSISFQIQDGPIKEVGLNGCQVDTIIAFATTLLESFNKQFPCRENSLAITKLQEAYFWLKARKKDREARGVEGHNKS